MTRAELEQYIKERIYPNNAQEITGEVLQNTLLAMVDYSSLTLTTKPNGNIEIGNLAGQTKEFMPATPSGDPMHYAYVTAGASYDNNTGHWKIYDLVDVTNEQMRLALHRGAWSFNMPSAFNTAYDSLFVNLRFTLQRLGGYNVTEFDATRLFRTASSLECINLTPRCGVFESIKEHYFQPSKLDDTFYGCTALRKIFGLLRLSSVTSVTNAFAGCSRLEEVWVNSLKNNISFADSPLLSKESLLYMIENCASSVSFTITLSAEVYAKCIEGGEWYSEVSSALSSTLSNKTTTITLASA